MNDVDDTEISMSYMSYRFFLRHRSLCCWCRTCRSGFSYDIGCLVVDVVHVVELLTLTPRLSVIGPLYLNSLLLNQQIAHGVDFAGGAVAMEHTVHNMTAQLRTVLNGL